MRVAGSIVVAVALLASAPMARAGDTVPAIDHSSFDALLRKYVDGRGMVDYKRWKENDVPKLQGYLKLLADVKNEPSLEREERLALWINAYNAITIKSVIDAYPIAGIRKIENVWSRAIWTVAGRTVSLDDIEHKILRPMKEPRIHFAIVCASIGCPKLRDSAFTAENLDKQLEEQVQRTFNDRTKLRVDQGGKEVHALMIFKWFGEDFGATEAQRLTWIAKHLDCKDEKKACLDKDATLSFLEWDWSLNDR